jgi:hypothetical protein
VLKAALMSKYDADAYEWTKEQADALRRTVINAHHAEPMAAIWGAGATWDHDGEAPVGQGAFRAGRGRSKR